MDTLPHSTEAEETILACMIEEPSLIPEFMDEGGGELIHSLHDLWKVLESIFKSGQPISWISFRQGMMDARMTDNNGRLMIPDGMFSIVLPRPMFQNCLPILQDKLMRRRVMLASLEIDKSISLPDPQEYRERVLSQLTKIGSAIQEPEPEESWEDIVNSVEEDWKLCSKGEKKSCLPSPWIAWNKMLGGIRKGYSLLLGARKMGKSSLLGHIAAHLSIVKQEKCLIVTYETSVEDYVKRLACNIGLVEGKFLFTPDLQPMPDAMRMRTEEAMKKIRKSPLRIIRGNGLNAHHIAHEVRKMKPSFVGVDYLMLLPKLPEIQHKEGTERVVAANSQALFNISREMDGTLMVLQHTATSGDRMGEARWSDQPENDSDITLVVEDGSIEVKSMRNGESGGSMPIKFDGARYRFTESVN